MKISTDSQNNAYLKRPFSFCLLFFRDTFCHFFGKPEEVDAFRKVFFERELEFEK